MDNIKLNLDNLQIPVTNISTSQEVEIVAVDSLENKPVWEESVERLINLLKSGYSLSVGFSGGKDSTCVLIIFLEAMRRVIAEGSTSVPKCYVLNSNTKREMPLIDSYAEWSLTQITIFAAKNNLPVEVHQVKPSLTGSFNYYCIGRGKLPRFPGQSRDCAISEKIQPQQKLVKKIEAENNCEIITLLGTRLDESAARKRSMERFDMDEVSIVEVEGKKTFAPIANFELDDVWELIAGCVQYDGKPARIYNTYTPNFDEMMQLYRDANSGTCGVIVGDKGNKSSCGSRFGCAWCTVSGERDNSLESMLEQDEAYSFMKPFVKFRQFLLNIRFDMNSRDFRGKRIDHGWMKVLPDYFKPEVKRQLLRFLITMDRMEVERAKKHEEMYYSGKIEKTELNLLLCYPMFENVTKDDILAIDFVWSLNRDFEEASPAARDYLAIHELGERYFIPEVPRAERITIPKARWFDVSNDLPNQQEVQGILPSGWNIESLDCDFADEMQVNMAGGFMYVDAVREHYYDLKKVDIAETCRAALRNRWISIRRADLLRYDAIARRHDYILRLFQSERPMKENEDGDMVMMNVHEYLIDNSIDQETFDSIKSDLQKQELADDYAFDLFGVESVVDAINELKDNKPKKGHGKPDTTVTNVGEFEMSANQMQMF
ncbi:hypothetical protein [Vibrio sp. 10N.239.312.D08]|uniref:hypothetical protein n=1 Tax=Vibrio sp. 10N.239.312.D08 TaxID=3229978 RepID=UPI0035540D7A